MYPAQTSSNMAADNVCRSVNDTSTSFIHSDLVKSVIWCSGTPGKKMLSGSESLRLSSDVTEKGEVSHIVV